MGAGKSKHSKEAKANRERYGKRAFETRKPLPVIVIVCDDARTAVKYFDELKRRVKAKVTLTVVRNPCDRCAPLDVIKLAKQELTSLQSPQSNDPDDQQSVWALVDLEGDPSRQQRGWEAKKAGEQAGITVALSKPCFELWTLLHLVDTGEMFDNCSAVITRVEAEWQAKFGQPFGPKAQADYSKIMSEIDEAAKRAKVHRERDDPSWTEVYLVIGDIENKSV